VILLGLTLLLALALALYGVPMARRAALKFGIVDCPDGRLKRQCAPVPYLGGLAIYLAFLISLIFTFEFRHDVLGIVLAGTLVMMLGLIDDFGVLTPGIKLTGQLLAVFILIKSGIRIEIATLPEWVDIALTVVWMVGIINAFNLLDIMDGLAAGIGVISAALLCIVAVLNGDHTIAFMLAALIGSLLGFLRYNWSPALIYMGDAGAMFIGLMLGSLSMIGKYTEGHSISLLTPVLILGMPIFDTLFVMYIRFLRGLPIFLGSPDHMAIRLRHWGLSVQQVVLLSYGGSACLGGIGLLVMSVPEPLALVLSAATIVVLGSLAVWLTRVRMQRGEAAISSPALGSSPVERTLLS
jgi:UDP-GlcNAc:undecaprenyl-phosphate GlcNAc-1-phosphate transferase